MRAGARVVLPKPRMNKLEVAWLAVLVLRPDVDRASFEAVKLRLADQTYYTPDFFVVMKSGLIEFHETKGYMRAAARVRLRVAADLYPEFQFTKITRPGGRWKMDPIPGAGDAR